MPRLRITSGPRAGTAFSFDRTVVIGRGGMADLSLGDHTVSRRHALLSRGEGAWLVTDLSTSNGTFVNDVRITQATTLEDGDRLTLGAVTTEFDESGAEETGPAPGVSLSLAEAEGGGATVLMRMDPEGLETARPGSREGVSQQPDSLSRRLRLLSDLAGTLSETFDETALLSRILDRLFDVLPQAERGFVMLRDPVSGEPVPKAVRTRAGDASVVAASRTLLREVIETRQGILSVDAIGDRRFSGAESMVGLGIRSVVCVPILARQHVYGVIQVDSTQPGQTFAADDMALMLGIGHQLGLSLANARLHSRLMEQELLQRDLLLAGRVQQRFLPRRLPEVEGYSFAVEYRPALELGGDFYAFLELADGRIGIAVGDVSGKGVSAALCVAKLSSDLRYHAAGQTEPAEILKRVNAALFGDLDEGMFVTAELLALNPATGDLKLASAGHPPPYVREAAGEVVPLGTTGGSALGVAEDAAFEQHTYVLDRADVVVLYTDGVTEAMTRESALFGEERLIATIRRSSRDPGPLLRAIAAEVEAFRGGEPPNDDLTIVCFGPGGS